MSALEVTIDTRTELIIHDAIGLLLMTVAVIAFLWAADVIEDARDQGTRLRGAGWPPPFCWLFAGFLIFTVGGVFGLLAIRILASDKPRELWVLALAAFVAVWPMLAFLSWSGNVIEEVQGGRDERG